MASGKQIRRPLHGVNLGGWLVVEKWMTPSLFAGTDAVDEYTFSQTAAQRKRLREHHRTFITEADFAWLAGHGIEAVRLPVGYWVFGDCQPFVGSITYVDKAFEWAEKYGLKILLDLHGAPGSQNGNDHSGQVGEIGWPSAVNMTATVSILQRLAKQYGQHPALLGISLLNEPSPDIPQQQLVDFYQLAAAAVRQHCKPDIWISISDNFRPRQWYRHLPELIIDYHHYQIFSDRDKRRSAKQQLRYARWLLPFKIWRMARHHPVIIGEWSLATPQDMSKAERVSYSTAQLRAFRRAQAWFFWSYKTETDDAWNYRSYVERGLF